MRRAGLQKLNAQRGERILFVRKALEAADFHIEGTEKRTMWVPVEIVLAVKEEQRRSDCRTAVLL